MTDKSERKLRSHLTSEKQIVEEEIQGQVGASSGKYEDIDISKQLEKHISVEKEMEGEVVKQISVEEVNKPEIDLLKLFEMLKTELVNYKTELISNMNERLDNNQEKMKKRLDNSQEEMKERLDNSQEKMNDRFDKQDYKFREIDKRFDEINNRFDRLERNKDKDIKELVEELTEEPEQINIIVNEKILEKVEEIMKVEDKVEKRIEQTEFKVVEVIKSCLNVVREKEEEIKEGCIDEIRKEMKIKDKRLTGYLYGQRKVGIIKILMKEEVQAYLIMKAESHVQFQEVFTVESLEGYQDKNERNEIERDTVETIDCNEKINSGERKVTDNFSLCQLMDELRRRIKKKIFNRNKENSTDYFLPKGLSILRGSLGISI